MARRGEDTMRYGPSSRWGCLTARFGHFKDPANKDKKPYAVVQLRQEDKQGQLWNMVGFQTNLRWGEQKRVFRLIPGLEHAEFVRMGVMHRNTFINSPELFTHNPAVQVPRLPLSGRATDRHRRLHGSNRRGLAGRNERPLASPWVKRPSPCPSPP